MAKVSIKLGMKMGGYPESPVVSARSEEEFFPTLRLENVEELDLPKTGEITLKYRITRDTEETRKGEERRSVELDVLEICDVEGAESEGEDESTEDILKKLKASLE